MDGYNGWANRETWTVALWLDNDSGTYHYWREVAQYWMPNGFEAAVRVVEDRLIEEIRDGSVDLSDHGMMRDLLTTALHTVDWREIAVSRFDEEWEGVSCE